MVSKATKRATRWRTIRQRRASIAWTRETLAASLEPILTNALVAHCLVRLAQRHAGLRRHGRRWSSDLDEQRQALGVALSHVVHPGVDRAGVFEEVTARVADREGVLCAEAMAVACDHCVGSLRRPVDGTDVEAFWRVVRTETGTVIRLR